jgi:hypothetical protein
VQLSLTLAQELTWSQAEATLGETVFISRITLLPSNTELGFEFKQHQHPLCFAFSISINKTQRQLVKYVGLDLRNPVFSHGQFYVVILRATSVHRGKAI